MVLDVWDTGADWWGGSEADSSPFLNANHYSVLVSVYLHTRECRNQLQLPIVFSLLGTTRDRFVTIIGVIVNMIVK